MIILNVSSDILTPFILDVIRSFILSSTGVLDDSVKEKGVVVETDCLVGSESIVTELVLTDAYKLRELNSTEIL